MRAQARLDFIIDENFRLFLSKKEVKFFLYVTP